MDIQKSGGESGIRTHDIVAHITVFETAPFNRSGISPISKPILKHITFNKIKNK